MPRDKEGAEKLQRRVELITLSESSEHLIELPRVQDFQSIGIIINGTLQIATAVVTSVRANAPCQLLPRIDLIANGKDVLDQVPFVMVAAGNYQRGYTQEITAPGTTVATHPIRAVAWLDRNNINGIRPKDSAFQAWLTNLLQLRLTTGQASDMVVIGSAVLTLTATIEILIDSLDENDVDKGEAKAVKKRTFQSDTFSGANSDFSFRLPVSNWIKSVKLYATDDSEPTDSLINSAQIVLGGIDVRENLTYTLARSKNRADYRIGTDTLPSGFMVLDASPEGKLSNFWDVRDHTLAECIIDVAAPSGTGKIEMEVEEYIVPEQD